MIELSFSFVPDHIDPPKRIAAEYVVLPAALLIGTVQSVDFAPCSFSSALLVMSS